jgi:hypothetical protein
MVDHVDVRVEDEGLLVKFHFGGPGPPPSRPGPGRGRSGFRAIRRSGHCGGNRAAIVAGGLEEDPDLSRPLPRPQSLSTGGGSACASCRCLSPRLRAGRGERLSRLLAAGPEASFILRLLSLSLVVRSSRCSAASTNLLNRLGFSSPCGGHEPPGPPGACRT